MTDHEQGKLWTCMNCGHRSRGEMPDEECCSDAFPASVTGNRAQRRALLKDAKKLYGLLKEVK